MKRVIQLANVEAKDFVTVKEAAKSLGMSIQAVRNYLNRGIFVTYKFKGQTLLATGQVVSYDKKRKNGK